MEQLKEFDLCYLATPYSKYPAGIEMAFVEAARIAGELVEQGCRIYSPIAHTHPLARYANLDPLDHKIWLPFDESMMRAAQALVVAMMDTWENSYGIRYEIETFVGQGKPVFYLDPVSFEVRSTIWSREAA